MKTHELCTTIVIFNMKRKGFSNLTGAFHNKSSRGNLFVTVLYDYDSNEILYKPIKNRQAATIRDYFLKIHNIIKSGGSNTKFYMMDNKCSIDLKEDTKEFTIYFQLAPPHMHRQNSAEWAIRT